MAVTNTISGFDFDQADRDKVVAAVSGNSNEALACRRLIRESRIYDVQRLVERAYEEVDPTDEVRNEILNHRNT